MNIGKGHSRRDTQMGNYYDKKSTGGRTTSKIENQDSVAAIYALEQLYSTDVFGFGIKIGDFCIKCEGEEDIEIFNLEKHIFIQLKSSVIGKGDLIDILDHFLTLNNVNTSTENFFVITSFAPIRVNEKNFKEYLDDYVHVLVNPYETEEKKRQVKDEFISTFCLSKYAHIIDRVRVEVRPLFKDNKDTKAIFGRYLRLNYIFKDPGNIIVDNLYANLNNKFSELRRNRGAITKTEIEAFVNGAISKGSVFSGLALSVGYSKIENGYVENEQKVKKRDLIINGFKKAKKDIMRRWRKAYRKDLIINCILGAKSCPQCGHPMMANMMGISGIACPDCGYNPYVTMFIFCECGAYEMVKAQPELEDDKQIQYLKEFFDERESDVCKVCGKKLIDEYVENRIFYAPIPYPFDEIKNIDKIYKNSRY